jgi:hypothetical protein
MGRKGSGWWRPLPDGFAELYPFMTNADLGRRFGMSASAAAQRGDHRGLRKDPAHWAEMQRRRSLGRKLSPESRAKIGAAAMGRIHSPEILAKALRTKQERGTLLRGDRHPNWKGGRPWERFKRPEYLEWRRAVLERDAYRCRDCGRQCRKREKGLAAHHILGYAGHPQRRYDVTNGVTLCRDCHMIRHGRPRRTIEVASCACGCGTIIPVEDPYGRPRRFVNHHHPRGVPKSESAKEKSRAKMVGRRLTSEHRAKISAGLRSRSTHLGRPPNRVPLRAIGS